MTEKKDYNLAPREFISQFNQLSPGDKANLRRADNPQTLAAFWQCYNKAKQVNEQLSNYYCERLIPFARLLKQQEAIQNKKNLKGIGLWLRANKENVHIRRIEAIFAAETMDELLDDLLAVAGIAKDGDSEIDFGRFYWDLVNFAKVVSRQKTLRSWARDYFSN